MSEDWERDLIDLETVSYHGTMGELRKNRVRVLVLFPLRISLCLCMFSWPVVQSIKSLYPRVKCKRIQLQVKTI